MRSPLSGICEVAAILRSEKVAHALIGGWAVITWGYLRTSDDFDLLVDLPPSKRRRLLAALSGRWDAEWVPGGEDDPIPGLVRARPKDKGLPVDLLPATRAADREALSRAIEVPIEGGSIPVVAPEDLIAMKLEAGGGQDYEDVRRLLSVLGAKLDSGMLRRRCDERLVADRLALIEPPKP